MPAAWGIAASGAIRMRLLTVASNGRAGPGACRHRMMDRSGGLFPVGLAGN